MRDAWMETTLGSVCDLTKGATPTQKARPGPYPLVVTAEDRASCDKYQFDTEAVCVPMVSSTGHGHASLKRVHYQAGKFAVANIITACTAKLGAAVDMKYLWLLLDHFRDQLIVPLMKGTANVSLSQRSLAMVPIQLPPPAEQRRIVDLIGALDDVIAASDAATVAIRSVRGSFCASAWNDGELRDLSTIGTMVTGATPSTRDPRNWESADIPFITPGDVAWGGSHVSTAERRVSRAATASSSRTLEDGACFRSALALLLERSGPPEGLLCSINKSMP